MLKKEKGVGYIIGVIKSGKEKTKEGEIEEERKQERKECDLGSLGGEGKSPALAMSPCSSPNISVGPPQSPPTNPYTNLFNSGLYQQYLGQLLANGGGPPPLNPMLLQVCPSQSYSVCTCVVPAGAAGHGRPEQPRQPARHLQQPRLQPDLGAAEGKQVLAVPGALHHQPHRLEPGHGPGLPTGHHGLGLQVPGRAGRQGPQGRAQDSQPTRVASALRLPSQVLMKSSAETPNNSYGYLVSNFSHLNLES